MKKIVLPILAALAMAAQTNSDPPQFTSDGQLVLPKDYREWVYLSSGLGMNYGPAAQADQGNPMFDNVFVSPVAYKAFLEHGRWPDKTMFILEVRRAIGKGSINNGGHYQNDVVTIGAAVKDEERFPQKWAYFGFSRGDKAAPLPANSACNSCHNQNAAVENTFVQFYPNASRNCDAQGHAESGVCSKVFQPMMAPLFARRPTQNRERTAHQRPSSFEQGSIDRGIRCVASMVRGSVEQSRERRGPIGIRDSAAHRKSEILIFHITEHAA